MSKITPVQTANAPPPAASYSQAVKVNGFVYVSGQIPLTPDGKNLEKENASTAEKTEQVIQNVKNVLEAANSDLAHVVKCTCFLADMDQFAEFNEVYAKHFGATKPSRSCVAVKQLPLGCTVEIEVVAIEKS
ncbi:protein Mmf1p, mitochondrial [Diutina catenulata]